MSKKSTERRRGQHVALLLVEGDTEEEFYNIFTECFCHSQPKKIKNLKGNFNINDRIADAIVQYANNNPADTFDVYVCIDQEQLRVPACNPEYIKNRLKDLDNFKKLVPVVAVLMIESLFFLDMDGLYRYLRAARPRKWPEKYRNFRQLTHRDLSTLFRQHDKQYHKGFRCEGLVAALDLERLRTGADELKNLVVCVGTPT